MQKQHAISAINWCLLAMAVLVPLIFWQQTMFPFVIVKTAIFQALAEAVIFLWAALAIREKAFRPRWTPLATALAALLAWLFIASFAGLDLGISLWSTQGRALGLVSLLHFFLLYIALSSLKNEVKWRSAWIATLAASIFAALGALLTPGSAFIQKFFLQENPVSDLTRPGSTFNNPSFLAGYLVFAVFLGILFYFKEKGLWKWFGAASAIIDALGVLRTQTRGDVLGVAVGIFLIAVFFAHERFRPFEFRRSVLKNGWLLFVIAFLVLGGVFFATRSAPLWRKIPGIERVAATDFNAEILQNRLYAWEGAWHAILERPATGWGFENFNLAFQKYYDPRLLTNTFDETYWDKPHDILIEYAVAGGFPALLLYLGAGAVLFYEIRRSRLGRTEKYLFAAAFAAYFVQNLVLFDTIGTYLLAALFAAHIDGHYAPAEAEKKPAQAKSAEGDPLYVAALVAAVILAYVLNFNMVEAAHLEYGGPSNFLLKNPAASVASFDAALKLPSPYRDATAEDFASVVKQAYDQGDVFPDIKNLVERLKTEEEGVIARHPNNYFHYAFLAEYENTFSAIDPSYLKDAEALEAKALALTPRRQQVYYIIAKTKLLEGDFQAGYDAFQTAVNLNPDAGDPHFYFGLLAFEKGDTAKGIAEIERAKSLGRGPKNAGEAMAVGDDYGDKVGDYGKAVEYYQDAIALDPRLDTLHFNAELKTAIAYYLNGQFPDAKYMFDELQKQGVDFSKLTISGELPQIWGDIGFTPAK